MLSVNHVPALQYNLRQVMHLGSLYCINKKLDAICLVKTVIKNSMLTNGVKCRRHLASQNIGSSILNNTSSIYVISLQVLSIDKIFIIKVSDTLNFIQ